MRILVVDDDATALEIRKLLIERCGHQVTAAADPEAARGAFPRGFDVVILDLRLPELETGLELLREFRTARVIVLCGNAGDLDGRPEAALAATVLQKPVRSEALLRAIGG